MLWRVAARSACGYRRCRESGSAAFAGRPRGGVVTQRTANPCTPVRFRAWPPTQIRYVMSVSFAEWSSLLPTARRMIGKSNEIVGESDAAWLVACGPRRRAACADILMTLKPAMKRLLPGARGGICNIGFWRSRDPSPTEAALPRSCQIFPAAKAIMPKRRRARSPGRRMPLRRGSNSREGRAAACPNRRAVTWRSGQPSKRHSVGG